ncbi:hypothetical protein C2E23DRAFT_24571 [Lenzites betulinus]|nr:hypothetical protein C2E23DRAFT_24571 [Lenzites betulinus]
MSSHYRPVDAINRPEGPQVPEMPHAVPYHSAHVPHHAVILDSESNAQLSEADNHSTTVGSPFMILPQEKYKTRLLSVTLLPPVHFYGFGLRSALDEKTGGLVDGDGAAFEEGVVLPQKMTIMLLFPGCTRYKRQANILRARAKPPTRAQLSAIIAREVLRFLTQARQEGTPLRFQGHEICGLEDLVLIDVFHVSKSSLQPVIGMAGAV